MKIAVIGAGAIGSLFAGLLAEGREDVTLIVNTKEKSNILKQEGLRIEGVSGNRTIKIKSTDNPSGINRMDLVILAVKSYHTEQAVKEALPMIGRNTIVITIQNGLYNLEKISQFVDTHQIIGGVTMHGATILSFGKIFHAGEGITIIGELKTNSSGAIKKIAKNFNKCKITTRISNNIKREICKKVIINSCINPITALTGLRNGDIIKIPETKSIMKKTFQESKFILSRYGFNFKDSIWRSIVKTVQKTAKNKSSMLQDIKQGKKTEIDYLNGAILKMGQKYGLDTTINGILVGLIRGLEMSIENTRCIYGNKSF